MMKYEDALKEWGARFLESNHLKSWGKPKPIVIDRSTVVVKMEFEPVYGFCCGSEECYCSFADSPTSSVEISGMAVEGSKSNIGRTFTSTIDASSFDFVKVLGEIVEAGGGNITS